MEVSPGPWKWYWRVDEETGEADCGIYYEKFPGHAYSVMRCPRYQSREQWEADAKFVCEMKNTLEDLFR